MESEILEFESPHFLQSLFADDLSLLKELEEALSVRVTTRDGWVKFEGEAANVSSAQRVLRDLESARRQGADISSEAFRFAVASASSG